MIKKIKLLALSLVAIATPVMTVAPMVKAAECDLLGDVTAVSNIITNCTGSSVVSGDLGTVIQKIISIMTTVIIIGAVVMIIVGGFQYVFSQGDEKALGKAKNTILYAIVGIIVALLARIIVNFALTAITK